MSPVEVQPAIARILMRAAGPADEAAVEAIRVELGRFDEIEPVIELAVQTAIACAGKVDDGAGLYIADGSDLIAFSMISIAGDHPADVAEPVLAEVLSGMAYAGGMGVAISLLAMWRTLCSQAARRALADLQIPATIPEDPR